MTKPRYCEQILPVSCPFVTSRFHCTLGWLGPTGCNESQRLSTAWAGIGIWWGCLGLNRPFSSSPSLCFKTRVGAQPLIWKSFFILMQIKLIFTRKVLHLASFWKWGFLEPGSGLWDSNGSKRGLFSLWPAELYYWHRQKCFSPKVSKINSVHTCLQASRNGFSLRVTWSLGNSAPIPSPNKDKRSNIISRLVS